MPVKACVFDAYGTLFDVAAAARAAAREPDFQLLAELWPKLAADWRAKQLEYTWLRAAAGAHADFWAVTCDSLDWALEAAGLSDPALRDRLLALYRELDTYPEVPAALSALKARGMRLAILSNGTPGMLNDAVASAGISDLFEALISVEEVGVYKPANAIYQHVETRLSLPPSEVLFISSNGWDACCGAGFGFTTAWVNRASAPLDRLHGRPAHVIDDLTGLVDLI